MTTGGHGADGAAKPGIAYQGEPGAYSHQACSRFFPDHEPLACPTFEDAFQALDEGRVALGMIPVENSLAGRVADIHHLLPEADMHAVGERFLPIHHQLLAPQDATLATVQEAFSHPMAIGQCRVSLRALGLKPVVAADTAGSARMVAEAGDPTRAAVASALAGEIHGLKVLRADIHDAGHNTTRFLILSKERQDAPLDAGPVITSFLFRVRNVPSALYKAMGGFATNGVNMLKLESYQLEGTFWASQFLADIEGHPEDLPVRLALEELAFFSSHLRIIGTYPADPFRKSIGRTMDQEAVAQGTSVAGAGTKTGPSA